MICQKMTLCLTMLTKDDPNKIIVNDHNELIPFTNANLVGKLLSCEPFFIKVFVIMRNM